MSPGFFTQLFRVVLAALLVYGALLAFSLKPAKKVCESPLQTSKDFSKTLLGQEKLVVMASNQNIEYLFHVPILAYVWRDYYDLGTIMLTVGDESDWCDSEMSMFVWNWLQIAAEETRSVLQHTRVPSANSASISQTIRLVASAWDALDLDTTIVTSDADLVLINKTLLDMHQREILVTNGFCCTTQRYKGYVTRHLPMSHVAMKVRSWRKVLQLEKQFPIEQLGQYALKYIADAFEGDGTFPWTYDQVILSHRIGKYVEQFPDSIFLEYFAKDLSHLRIDRIKWPNVTLDRKFVSGSRDAHLFRFNGAKAWNKERDLFVALLSDAVMARVDQYVNEFAQRFPLFWEQK
jgi:hypothetical protein